MRLQRKSHDQSQKNNWRKWVTGPELPFFHKIKGVLKLDQSVKMVWHSLSMGVLGSYSSIGSCTNLILKRGLRLGLVGHFLNFLKIKHAANSVYFRREVVTDVTYIYLFSYLIPAELLHRHCPLPSVFRPLVCFQCRFSWTRISLAHSLTSRNFHIRSQIWLWHCLET